MLLFVAMAILGNSCQNRPKEVLNRKQMERLMYDVYIAEATMENDYQSFATNEEKEAYINRVFEQHKVTAAQWDSSLAWYSDRIDLYLRMNDSVKARLQRSRQEIDAAIARQGMDRETDPALLPPSFIPTYYSFATPDTKRGFRFRLDSTEISSRITGDEFRFVFSTVGIPPRFSTPFTSLLALVYSDTTLYRFQELRENKTYEFSGLKYIPGDTITEISGFVHLQDSEGMTRPIQLYNIFLGDKEDVFPDSLKVAPDSLKKMPLLLDSVESSLPTPMDSVQLDSLNVK